MSEETGLYVSELDAQEAVIERGLRVAREAFWDIGRALIAIRDRKLYRAEYRSFEDYVAARWGFSRPRAYQFIDAAAVNEDLSTRVDIPLPATEHQARQLARLDDPDARAAAWEVAHQEAGGQPTAPHVRGVVDALAAAPTSRTAEEEDTGPAPGTPEAVREARSYVQAVRDFPELEGQPQSVALDYARAVWQDPDLYDSGRPIREIADEGRRRRLAQRAAERESRRIGDPAHPAETEEERLVEAYGREHYRIKTHLLLLDPEKVTAALDPVQRDLARRFVKDAQDWLRRFDAALAAAA